MDSVDEIKLALEAIDNPSNYIEPDVDTENGSLGLYFSPEWEGIAKTIREALCERQGRVRPDGCGYCRDGVYYDILGSPCRYNFCPICGRKLNQPE